MKDQTLVRKAESVFIKKECDTMAPNVIASVITAASKMSIPAGIVSEEATLEELIEAYGVIDNQQVLELIGLSPTFVKSAIGYSPDFNDMGHASVVFVADRDNYVSFYNMVKARIQEKEALLNDNIHQI